MVSEWIDMFIRGLLFKWLALKALVCYKENTKHHLVEMFILWYSWQTVHFVLNNNQVLLFDIIWVFVKVWCNLCWQNLWLREWLLFYANKANLSVLYQERRNLKWWWCLLCTWQTRCSRFFSTISEKQSASRNVSSLSSPGVNDECLAEKQHLPLLWWCYGSVSTKYCPPSTSYRLINI